LSISPERRQARRRHNGTSLMRRDAENGNFRPECYQRNPALAGAHIRESIAHLGGQAVTISDVQPRIFLTDIERPNEPLDVEILELSATDLTVKVANTEVLFHLRKRETGMMFEGALGARSFEFDAQPLAKPAAKATKATPAAKSAK
jgi:hypothetical protein